MTAIIEKDYLQKVRTYRLSFVWSLLCDIMESNDSILGRYHNRDKLHRLYKKFISLEDADRFFIVNNLSESDNDVSRTLLEKVLINDSNKVVRHEAAFSLGYIGDELTPESLRQAISSDESILVRHEAIMALSEVGSFEDMEFIEQVGSSDDNEEVILSCKVASKRLSDRLNNLLPPSL